MMTKRASLRETLTLEGTDIFSGERSRVRIHPAREGSGYTVAQGRSRAKATLDTAVHCTKRGGSFIAIESGGVQVGKIEHVLSVLFGADIQDAVIEPAREFCPRPDAHGYADLFAGLRELRLESAMERTYLTLAPGFPARQASVTNPHGPDSIRLANEAGLVIDYTARYPHLAIGTQELVFPFSSERYGEEIAWARGPVFVDTLCRRLGVRALGKGITAENSLLIGNAALEGTLNESAPREFVRHKILDEIGAIALVGDLQDVRVTCRMTGHAFSLRAYRELRRRGAFAEYAPIYVTAGARDPLRAAASRPA